jgi:hypothetical protein
MDDGHATSDAYKLSIHQLYSVLSASINYFSFTWSRAYETSLKRRVGGSDGQTLKHSGWPTIRN